MASPVKKDTKKATTQDFMDMIMASAEKDDDFAYVYRSGDDDENFMVPKFNFRSGVHMIDTIVGEGGFASSKISEIYGPNKSGKSELAQQVCGKFLMDNPDGICMYFDQETAIDDKKFKAMPILGCGRFLVRKGKSMESCFNSILKLALILAKDKIERPVLYVFDSVASIETEEEIKGEIGKGNYAPQARVLSQALRKIRGVLLRTNAHLMCINQTREKPGSFSGADSACGNALKFYSDYRVKMVNIGVYRFGKADENRGPDGFKILITTVKNKRVTPVRKVVVPLLFHSIGALKSGLSDTWSIWDEFKKWKLLKKAKNTGGWYKLVTSDGRESEPMQRSGFYDMYLASLDSPESGRFKPESQLALAMQDFTPMIMDSEVSFTSDGDDEDEDDDEDATKPKTKKKVEEVED